MYHNFMKYEDLAVDFFADSDINKRILTRPEAGDIKQKIMDSSSNTKNPYREALVWLMGEQLDMKGMLDALLGRDAVMKQQVGTEQKRRDNQTELDKLETNKTSFKNFFKSKDSKEKSKLTLKADIEASNHMIDDYRKLIGFITIHHGLVVIDKFKKDKINQYKRMLRCFSVREMTNCHIVANLCKTIVDLNEGGEERETE